jgi:hypothetical protein
MTQDEFEAFTAARPADAAWRRRGIAAMSRPAFVVTFDDDGAHGVAVALLRP